MMWGYQAANGGYQAFGWAAGLWFLTWLVVLVDLLLFGFWLWKQINKK